MATTSPSLTPRRANPAAASSEARSRSEKLRAQPSAATNAGAVPNLCAAPRAASASTSTDRKTQDNLIYPQIPSGKRRGHVEVIAGETDVWGMYGSMRLRSTIVLVLLALVSASCGARLSHEQSLAAKRGASTGHGAGGVSAGAATNTESAGAATGTGTPSAGTGAATGAATSGGTTSGGAASGGGASTPAGATPSAGGATPAA